MCVMRFAKSDDYTAHIMAQTNRTKYKAKWGKWYRVLYSLCFFTSLYQFDDAGPASYASLRFANSFIEKCNYGVDPFVNNTHLVGGWSWNITSSSSDCD